MQPGQLQDSEYLSLRSHSQPTDYKSSSESGGERSKQTFIRLVLLHVGTQGCWTQRVHPTSSGILDANPGREEALTNVAPQH